MKILAYGVLIYGVILAGCAHHEKPFTMDEGGGTGTIVKRHSMAPLKAYSETNDDPYSNPDKGLPKELPVEWSEMKLANGVRGYLIGLPSGTKVFLTKDRFTFGRFDEAGQKIEVDHRLASVIGELSGWHLAGLADLKFLTEACQSLTKQNVESPEACTLGSWAQPDDMSGFVPIIMAEGLVANDECTGWHGIMFVEEKPLPQLKSVSEVIR